jgi:hypothetical protein
MSPYVFNYHYAALRGATMHYGERPDSRGVARQFRLNLVNQVMHQPLLEHIRNLFSKSSIFISMEKF